MLPAMWQEVPEKKWTQDRRHKRTYDRTLWKLWIFL